MLQRPKVINDTATKANYHVSEFDVVPEITFRDSDSKDTTLVPWVYGDLQWTKPETVNTPEGCFCTTLLREYPRGFVTRSISREAVYKEPHSIIRNNNYKQILEETNKPLIWLRTEEAITAWKLSIDLPIPHGPLPVHPTCLEYPTVTTEQQRLRPSPKDKINPYGQPGTVMLITGRLLGQVDPQGRLLQYPQAPPEDQTTT